MKADDRFNSLGHTFQHFDLAFTEKNKLKEQIERKIENKNDL